MPTRRQERVAKRIVREAAEAVRSVKHMTVGFITVTNCEVSPDLRHAKVFISVLGSDEEKERTMFQFRRNASRLRGIIGRSMGMKATPELHFELDESLATSDRINRLIADARQSDANPNPLTEEEMAALRETASGERESRWTPEGKEEGGGDSAFDQAREEVEEELLEGEDDAGWKPIDLNELPED